MPSCVRVNQNQSEATEGGGKRDEDERTQGRRRRLRKDEFDYCLKLFHTSPWKSVRLSTHVAASVCVCVCVCVCSPLMCSLERPHGLNEVWRSYSRLSDCRLLIRKITLSEFYQRQNHRSVRPRECVCVCVRWWKTEGFSCRGICLLACVRFVCVFIPPPPRRPHAPSVSDWFGIHCHGETGRRRRERGGGGGRKKSKREGERAKDTAGWRIGRRNKGKKKRKRVFMPQGYNSHSRSNYPNRCLRSPHNGSSNAAIPHPDVRCHLRLRKTNCSHFVRAGAADFFLFCFVSLSVFFFSLLVFPQMVDVSLRKEGGRGG